ncbi:hypothetical protein COLO4_04739 [Corchorus olitorius]|uniref:Uncharacterized protein n=1 Tax=Corchorus olitorius TaxID=93759 RepID=A0A1R3KSX4_9ROSI|nr:hypothetical protein COLO4_04739 [Corchorus olitorius]
MPADLKEGIASLIFACPRCSKIPKLEAIRDIFEKKYGKDFVAAGVASSAGLGFVIIGLQNLSSVLAFFLTSADNRTGVAYLGS